MKKINLTVARLATLAAAMYVSSCESSTTGTTGTTNNTPAYTDADAVKAVETEAKSAKSVLKPLFTTTGGAGFTFTDAKAGEEFKSTTEAQAKGIKKAGLKADELEKLAGLGSADEIEDFVKANASRKELIAKVKTICNTNWELGMKVLGYGPYLGSIVRTANLSAIADAQVHTLVTALGVVTGLDGSAVGSIFEMTACTNAAHNGLYKITAVGANNALKASKLGADGKLAAAVVIGA